MKTIAFLFVTLFVATARADKIVVSAAVSLKESLQQIAADYKQKTGGRKGGRQTDRVERRRPRQQTGRRQKPTRADRGPWIDRWPEIVRRFEVRRGEKISRR